MYNNVLNRLKAILLGRVAYQLLADQWPSAINNIAPKMKNLPKIVFSKTLEKVKQNNPRLIKDNIADEVSKIKQQPGKDLVLFAGADIASTFIQPDLIDEYHIIVNPIILGGGKPSFGDVKYRLKLLETRTFSCGYAILHYQSLKNQQISMSFSFQQQSHLMCV